MLALEFYLKRIEHRFCGEFKKENQWDIKQIKVLTHS